MDWQQILTAVGILALVSIALSVMLIVAEYFFANYGECEVDVNRGEKTYTVQGGNSLLSTMKEHKLYLPSACGGRGSCGVCKCKVPDGAGPVLPTELPYLNDEEIESDVRLSCQVKIKNDIRIEVPEELLSVKQYTCTVEKITELTHDIRGIRFKLPEGESVKFKAGQYVNLVAPPYGDVKEETARAYSIASSPEDETALELVIRLVPNGICTTYVFEHLNEGDEIKIIGPFGDFFLRDTEREIICIAGGSGLAPIRSILMDMLRKGIDKRRTCFFFGALTEKDLYYIDENETWDDENDWYHYIPALSKPDGDTKYEVGLITDVVDRHYDKLDNHEAYLCGSPGMIDACVKVLTNNGMPEDLIYYDKFS